MVRFTVWNLVAVGVLAVIAITGLKWITGQVNIPFVSDAVAGV
jgi:hypothetical protein